MPRLKPLLVALCLLAIVLGGVPAEAAPAAPAPTPIFVDTDIGVDDAVAIAWLLEQRGAQVVGFSTVFGNTSTENAAANLLTLLDAADVTVPVSVGAAAPLVLPRSRTGSFVHGPDGFWFAQQPQNTSALPHNAADAIAAAARANPNLTIVALGPLTNIAQAVQAHPADMADVHVIALGGAKRGGNRTSVAEFNIYADPHALAVLLESDVRLELVTLDAFSQITVDGEQFVRKVAAKGGQVGQLLSRILPTYFQTTASSDGTNPAIPDVAAVVYALRPDLASSTSALVAVITDDGPARGLTLIGNTFNDRITLIATDAELSLLADRAFTPGFDLALEMGMILQREPDNARVVLTVDSRRMVRLLERSLTR